MELLFEKHILQIACPGFDIQPGHELLGCFQALFGELPDGLEAEALSQPCGPVVIFNLPLPTCQYFRYAPTVHRVSAELAEGSDGSDVVLLVARAPGVPGVSSGESLLHPSWSPDGSKIVYDGGDWTIHVVNADGTGDVAIIPGGNVTADSPDWGP